MGLIEQSIEVDVPVHTAYNQWTQFEEFPKFMEGVESITQLDDKRLQWVVEIGGQRREWTGIITEQTPDQRIAWKSEGETGNAGVVTFHRLDDSRCKVMLQLEYQTSDFAEKAGEMLGIIERRVKADLERFKAFIEARGRETGAWRGEIKQVS
ncbi:MAG TPA: SRPBCC family protein [Actinomycetota bacterium]|nr:SRPBCC family protein [Actinomycetota bacterium]